VDGEIAVTKSLLESRVIHFELGRSEISDEQLSELKKVASDIQRLDSLFRRKRSPMRIEIIGYADRPGSQVINRTLRRRRAEAVMSALSALGLSSGGFSMADPDKGSSELVRKVSFSIQPVSQ
jgi:outer membrane protein OmpA-like peptidoglycan-associated protein